MKTEIVATRPVTCSCTFIACDTGHGKAHLLLIPFNRMKPFESPSDSAVECCTSIARSAQMTTITPSWHLEHGPHQTSHRHFVHSEISPRHPAPTSQSSVSTFLVILLQLHHDHSLTPNLPSALTLSPRDIPTAASVPSHTVSRSHTVAPILKMTNPSEHTLTRHAIHTRSAPIGNFHCEFPTASCWCHFRELLYFIVIYTKLSLPSKLLLKKSISNAPGSSGEASDVHSGIGNTCRPGETESSELPTMSWGFEFLRLGWRGNGVIAVLTRPKLSSSYLLTRLPQSTMITDMELL